MRVMQIPPEAALIALIVRRMVNDKGKIGELLNSGEISWARFKHLIAYHQLTPFAYLALKEFSSLLPRDLYALLRNSYYCDLVRCERFWQEFLCISAAFKRAQIKILPIKGIALLEDLYARHPARPMIDIDLLAEEKEILTAEKILNDLGYRKSFRECEKKYWREKQIHFAFHKKENETSFPVELHWALDFKRKNRFALAGFWERIRTIKAGGMEIRLLSLEDTLFSLALHSRRFGKALCLKNVCDAVLLLDKYAGSFDWDYCLKMSKKYELNSVLFFALCQVQLLSDKNIPEHVWKRLRVSKFKRAVIRWFIKKNTFSQHMDKRGKSLYLTSHFLLYDTFWEPAAYIFNIPKEQFARYYGLSLPDTKTELLYRFRFLYIPFRQITDCFKRGNQSKEAEPELNEEKNGVKDLAATRAWGWSMYPNIRNGDYLILKKKRLRIGGIVCFKDKCGKNVVHRVIKLNKRRLVTKGDNSLKPDQQIENKKVMGVVVAVKREDKILNVKGKYLYGYFYPLSCVIIIGRRAVKKFILRVQDFGFYSKIVKYIFRNKDVEIEKAVEADDFYFIRAKINSKEAGWAKIGKKDFSILALYVKINYRKLGIEQRLLEAKGALSHKEMESGL
jgi:signal peptidase I